MTKEQLQDALGMIDDDLLAHVDNLRQTRDQDPTATYVVPFRKKILRREFLKWGSLAAGICLLIGIGSLWRTGATTADSSIFEDYQYSNQENAGSCVEDKVEMPEKLIETMAGECETFRDATDQKSESETSPETKPDTTPSDSWPTPPTLVLFHGANSFIANRGAYSWSQKGQDGHIYFVTTEALHPLECKHFLTPVNTSDPLLQPDFQSAPGEPTEITATCWSDAHWGDISAEAMPIPLKEDNRIPLQEGNFIYQVAAKWPEGTVYYYFYVCYTEVSH